MVAQLVEHKLPKLGVASSNLVRRFRFVGPDLALRQGIRRGGGQLGAGTGAGVCGQNGHESTAPLWPRDSGCRKFGGASAGHDAICRALGVPRCPSASRARRTGRELRRGRMAALTDRRMDEQGGNPISDPAAEHQGGCGCVGGPRAHVAPLRVVGSAWLSPAARRPLPHTGGGDSRVLGRWRCRQPWWSSTAAGG